MARVALSHKACQWSSTGVHLHFFSARCTVVPQASIFLDALLHKLHDELAKFAQTTPCLLEEAKTMIQQWREASNLFFYHWQRVWQKKASTDHYVRAALAMHDVWPFSAPAAATPYRPTLRHRREQRGRATANLHEVFAQASSRRLWGWLHSTWHRRTEEWAPSV